MRILLISPYFPPQNAVASRRTHAFASEWAGAGEHVTVLTTIKRDDQQGLELPRNGFEVVELDCCGPRWIEKIRASHKRDSAGAMTTPSESRGWLRSALAQFKERTGIYGSVRMPDLTDYWVKPAIEWCIANAKEPWDVAVSSAGPYTAHLVGMALKRRGLVRRWVAEFRDLWTDNHIFKGLFPFTLRERQLERQCLGEADLIIAATDGLAGSLSRIARKPVEVIYNGFDAEAVSALPPERVFANDGCTRLVYTGTYYPRGQDFTPLLGALARLRTSAGGIASRLRVVMAGTGFQSVQERAVALGVNDLFEWRGKVDRDEALRMQRDADALLLLDWTKPGHGVLTGKLFEYLGAMAPVLVIGGEANSPIADMVRRAGRGIHLGRDEDRIAAALMDLLEEPMKLRTPRTDEFINGLTRQRQSLRLLELVRQLHAAKHADITRVQG